MVISGRGHKQNDDNNEVIQCTVNNVKIIYLFDDALVNKAKIFFKSPGDTSVSKAKIINSLGDALVSKAKTTKLTW